jgi:hypothetical protein
VCSNYHDVWGVICDYQTLIAGGFAGLAAVIGGGLAYFAGVKQAKATRDAADRHIRLLEQQNADLRNQRIAGEVLPRRAQRRQDP